MSPRKITYRNTTYWFLPDKNDESSGPIAPLKHCDEEGHLTSIDGDYSFAYIFEGTVRRHNRIIGWLKDGVITPKRVTFATGQRVIYIPGHADGDPSHKDCEHGVIMSFGNINNAFIHFDKELGSTNPSCDLNNLVEE